MQLKHLQKSYMSNGVWVMIIRRSLTNSLTHPPTHSLTHLLTHSLTYSLTHSLTHSGWHRVNAVHARPIDILIIWEWNRQRNIL